MKSSSFLLLACALAAGASAAAERPRARALRVPLPGATGALNAITDVPGVEVGQTTLISGEGKREAGKGPVRTGVTAILPRGRASDEMVMAGWFPLNGNGEVTGAAWLRDSGFLNGPIALTNTHSVGAVRDGTIAWRVKHGRPDAEDYWWSLPVVGEIDDSFLSDMNGFHVRETHVHGAIDGARAGPVAEGSVGGGTGAVCFGFKGGIGTSSRRVAVGAGTYMLGALVQCNGGRKEQLTIAGAPVGREIPERPAYDREAGSIVIVIATDAPLLPHQLERVARRGAMGLARLGATSGNGSGDFVLAFSTANAVSRPSGALQSARYLPNGELDAVFEAAVQATEEAIVNALVAAVTMTGADGNVAIGLPHDALKAALAKYNRLAR